METEYANSELPDNGIRTEKGAGAGKKFSIPAAKIKVFSKY